MMGTGGAVSKETPHRTGRRDTAKKPDAGFLAFSRSGAGVERLPPFFHFRVSCSDMTFRIFTNDRGTKRGVFMYSALCPMKAESVAEAEAKAQSKYGGLPYDGPHGPIKAIEWPAVTQASKDWLAKHV